MSALTEALVAAQKELPTAIGRDSQGMGYRHTSLDRTPADPLYELDEPVIPESFTAEDA